MAGEGLKINGEYREEIGINGSWYTPEPLASNAFTSEQRIMRIQELWERDTAEPRKLVTAAIHNYRSDPDVKENIGRGIHKLTIDIFGNAVYLNLYRNQTAIEHRLFTILEEAVAKEAPEWVTLNKDRLSRKSHAGFGLLPGNIPHAIDYYGLATGKSMTLEEITNNPNRAGNPRQRVEQFRIGLRRESGLRKLLGL